MFMPTRHCERNEAIQSKWMAASRVALLAMAFSMFVPSQSFAMSDCETSFQQRLDKAGVVFEGRHISNGWHKSNYQSKKKPSRFNFNKRYMYLGTETYRADKTWKNIEKGQAVSTAFCIPLELNSSEFSSMSRLKELKRPLKEGSKIVVLNDPPSIEGKIYNSCDCLNGVYDVSSKEIKILAQKFPQGPTQ